MQEIYKDTTTWCLEGEEWKDVPEWEGLYQASSYGRVRSLSRLVKARNNHTRCLSRRILSQIYPNGKTLKYLTVALSNKNIKNKMTVHKIVFISFFGNLLDGMEIDHINGLVLDNSVKNLRSCTSRQNSQYYSESRDTSCDSVGVRFRPSNKTPYEANILIRGKALYLGSFNTESEASKYYDNAVALVGDNPDIPIDEIKKSVRINSTKYRGLSLHGTKNIWRVFASMNGKIRCYMEFPYRDKSTAIDAASYMWALIYSGESYDDVKSLMILEYKVKDIAGHRR